MSDTENLRLKFELSREARGALWKRLVEFSEEYLAKVSEYRVQNQISADVLREELSGFTLEDPTSAERVLEFLISRSTSAQLHTGHPLYFGVFNPGASPTAALGDALTSILNPQLASWTSAGFAIELEDHLLRQISMALKFSDTPDGVFTSGGTEANLTAVLSALVHRWPEVRKTGVRSLPGEPALYVSEDGHHSFLKAAQVLGLGQKAVRVIGVDSSGAMLPTELEKVLQTDRADGRLPFLIVATLGSTNRGSLDPLPALTQIARREAVWLHADAAWAGAAALVPELESLFQGLQQVDSLTIDTHKWLGIPMTAGIYLTRHKGSLEAAFDVDDTPYMPSSSIKSPVSQPFRKSLAWSRRSLGPRVFFPLAVIGWSGYRDLIRHHVELGKRLRVGLQNSGWEVLNNSPLPVVCFRRSGHDLAACQRLADRLGESGRAWITTTVLPGHGPCLRAGITNFRTSPTHIDSLLRLLDDLAPNCS